jgi:magnesium chelatase family protein
MSVARILCRAQVGLIAPRVDVEVHLGAGLPCFNIVGLPATEVKESKERVRAALVNSNFEFPAGRITINLAPAELPKDGGRFDLAIAIGILVASEQLSSRWALDTLEFFGELGLSGDLRPIRGALPAAAAAAAEGHQVVLPQGNHHELNWCPNLEAVIADSLRSVCEKLGCKEIQTRPVSRDAFISDERTAATETLAEGLHLSDVCGQTRGKRALEIAAAGGHSLLMVGPPGCGKTMLAERLPWLLPALTSDEALEVAMILSLSVASLPEVVRRPFRAPHHTASASAIIGGGAAAGPGEITVAHRGVLFLDELPEFDRRVLEALREPLETGRVAVSRVGAKAEYPASFQLIAAMNPCPCGHAGARYGRCRCKALAVERYRARLSGPLLDRLDLRVMLESVGDADLAEHRRTRHAPEAERAAAVDEQRIRSRIIATRARQLSRQGCLNVSLSGRALSSACRLDHAAQRVLLSSRLSMGGSLRSQDRLVRVARTIADLRESSAISEADVLEAVALRQALS